MFELLSLAEHMVTGWLHVYTRIFSFNCLQMTYYMTYCREFKRHNESGVFELKTKSSLGPIVALCARDRLPSSSAIVQTKVVFQRDQSNTSWSTGVLFHNLTFLPDIVFSQGHQTFQFASVFRTTASFEKKLPELPSGFGARVHRCDVDTTPNVFIIKGRERSQVSIPSNFGQLFRGRVVVVVITGTTFDFHTNDLNKNIL